MKAKSLLNSRLFEFRAIRDFNVSGERKQNFQDVAGTRTGPGILTRSGLWWHKGKLPSVGRWSDSEWERLCHVLQMSVRRWRCDRGHSWLLRGLLQGGIVIVDCKMSETCLHWLRSISSWHQLIDCPIAPTQRVIFSMRLGHSLEIK